MSYTAVDPNIKTEEVNAGCCRGEEPIAGNHVLTLKVLGAILAIFSVVQAGLDGAAGPTGCGWVSILAFVSAILAVFSFKRSIGISASVFSSLSVVISIIGLILDIIYTVFFNSLETCGGKDASGTLTYFGKKDAAAIASFMSWAKCGLPVAFLGPEKLFCSNKMQCYDMKVDLKLGGYIMGPYGSLRTAGTIFTGLVALFSLVLSIYSCAALCNCCVKTELPASTDENLQVIEAVVVPNSGDQIIDFQDESLTGGGIIDTEISISLQKSEENQLVTKSDGEAAGSNTVAKENNCNYFCF